VRLQGKNCRSNEVDSFEIKLQLFKEQIEKKNFSHFRTCAEFSKTASTPPPIGKPLNNHLLKLATRFLLECNFSFCIT